MNIAEQISEIKLQKIKSVEFEEGREFYAHRLMPGTAKNACAALVMFEEFFIEAPGRFPDFSHKHTDVITYMLDGSVLHRDSLGNKRILSEGDAQRLTSGKGVQHYINAQGNGVNHGIHMWINLPEETKNVQASYQQIQSKNFPVETSDKDDRVIKKICGIKAPLTTRSRFTFKDVFLPAASSITLKITENHVGFIYLITGFNGEVRINDVVVHPGEACFFEDADNVIVHSKKLAVHFVFVVLEKTTED